MLYLLIAIIGILITIFFVIGTHEAGHFIAARLLGVKVLRFSIGFGKSLWHWHDKKGTEYVIALIPLGGYVKMLDETEGDVKTHEKHLAFNRQPYYKKFLIVFAGPFVNILCALILYWIIFMVGFVAIKPVIGEVTPKSIAEAGGIKANQEIISVDDRNTPTWTSVLFRLIRHVGNQDTVKIETLKGDKSKTHILDLTDWKMSELTPDPLTSLGIKPYEPQVPLIIGVIATKSPALSSDLKLGDKIIAINNQPMKDWREVVTTITRYPNQTVQFTIEREGKRSTFPVKVGYQHSGWLQKTGYLGIAPNFQWPAEMQHKIQFGPLGALVRATQEIWDFTYFNVLLFAKLITGKLSMQSLGGPITIFQSAGDAINYGLLAFMAFLAFLSISLGVINLLPIPGLDGGHLFIYLIETIIRRPLPEQVLGVLYRLGFLLILFILIQAFINDILRL